MLACLPQVRVHFEGHTVRANGIRVVGGLVMVQVQGGLLFFLFFFKFEGGLFGCRLCF